MNKNSYAYIKSKVNVLGVIQSISQDRLSFQYVADELIEDSTFLIDIKIPAFNYSLNDILVEVVKEEWVVNQPTFSGMPLRTVEVKFKPQESQRHPVELFQTLKHL